MIDYRVDCLCDWPTDRLKVARTLSLESIPVWSIFDDHLTRADVFLCCLVTSCPVIPRSLTTHLLSNVGEFRVQMNDTGDCLSSPPTSEDGSPVVLSSCDGQVSQWVFTLTGSLMVCHWTTLSALKFLTFYWERGLYDFWEITQSTAQNSKIKQANYFFLVQETLKKNVYFKDVRAGAHCYCVSLLLTQIHTPRYASSARAKK